jgi:hypothetical protein
MYMKLGCKLYLLLSFLLSFFPLLNFEVGMDKYKVFDEINDVILKRDVCLCAHTHVPGMFCYW